MVTSKGRCSTEPMYIIYQGMVPTRNPHNRTRETSFWFDLNYIKCIPLFGFSGHWTWPVLIFLLGFVYFQVKTFWSYQAESSWVELRPSRESSTCLKTQCSAFGEARTLNPSISPLSHRAAQHNWLGIEQPLPRNWVTPTKRGVFPISAHLKFKPASSATETWNSGFSMLRLVFTWVGIQQSSQRTKRCWSDCTSWYAPLLIAIYIKQVFTWHEDRWHILHHNEKIYISFLFKLPKFISRVRGNNIVRGNQCRKGQ